MGSLAAGWDTPLPRHSRGLPAVERGGPLAALDAFQSPGMASSMQVPIHGWSLSIFIFLNFSSAEVCVAACAIVQCLEISRTCRQSTALLLLGSFSEGDFHYCLTPAGREVDQFNCLAKNRRRDFPLSTLLQATSTVVCLFPSTAFPSSFDPSFHSQPLHLFSVMPFQPLLSSLAPAPASSLSPIRIHTGMFRASQMQVEGI